MVLAKNTAVCNANTLGGNMYQQPVNKHHIWAQFSTSLREYGDLAEIFIVVLIVYF